MFTQVEQILKTFPEVRTVFCKTGRPEIANDVMGVHQTDVWTLLKPQDEWRPGLTRDALIAEMDRAALRERAGRQVRLQPADRDAGQRAGGGGQERRGRPALRPRPRRAPPEGGRDRARPGAAARGDGTSGRRPRAGCRRSASRSAATSWRGTGSTRPTCSTRSRPWAGRPSAPSSRGRSATRSRSACPRPGASDPERIRSIRDRRPAGPPDPLGRPGRHRVRGGPERGRARGRAAPGGGRGQRPGPRHRRLRRRGAGGDRGPGRRCRPATCSAGAASSSTSRRPRGGS